ncbi:hypothetical protein KYN89_02360 [Alteriqipengyuania sp. NZ-12B]|uniref:Helix-turn-helix domain-containing protein n=1 Tax=Alteriqipengyuania abyssalis TaxID=2860200 RepID=A0ABS7P9Y7_9SPHN|nr:hypothetical protein [Alteriqipengyuania abyssalis]MBY8335883.1 hypothetical protein [Alteriqipengyuania abyssalis]
MATGILGAGMKTLEQVCEDNNCSRGFLYLENKRGRLRFTKLGRATRIKAEDEQAWRDSLPVVTGEAA